MQRDLLIEQITRHEGVRLKPYTDTTGHLTIGIGRNLSSKGITLEEAKHLLNNDVDEAIKECFAVLPWFRALDTIRQAVITELVFNMGMRTFLTFKNTIAAIERRDYKAAGEGLRNSKWYQDVKANRGDKIISQLTSGLW